MHCLKSLQIPSNFCHCNTAIGYLFCKQVHVMARVGFLCVGLLELLCSCLLAKAKSVCLYSCSSTFLLRRLLYWIFRMQCHAVLKMTEEQAKIINFNDVSASSWSCVIPVYTAAINLCLSKMGCSRILNIGRVEVANLLYFDKDKTYLAIQCG